MVELISCGDFEEWFASLHEADQDAVAMVADLLEEYGVSLGHPHSSDVKGAGFALRELRPKNGRSPIRVFYGFDKKRRGVLLTGGHKSGVPKKRFYKQYVAKSGNIWEKHKTCE